jgi:hypothetical protein
LHGPPSNGPNVVSLVVNTFNSVTT